MDEVCSRAGVNCIGIVASLAGRGLKAILSAYSLERSIGLDFVDSRWHFVIYFS